MKRLFKQNYLWVLVLSFTFIAVTSSQALAQNAFTQSPSVLPGANKPNINKTEVNKVRDERCKKSGKTEETCKKGFDNTVASNGIIDEAFCSKTTGQPTGSNLNEYCKAGQNMASVIFNEYNQLFDGDKACGPPLASNLVNRCTSNFYRGLTGQKNTCNTGDSAFQAKCAYSFREGEKTAQTTRTYITQARNLNGDAASPDDEAGDGAASGEPELDCADSDALGWIVCPVVKATNTIIGQLDNAINDLLTVNTSKLFGDNQTGEAFHKAWSSFRIFALGFVVIMALVVIISTAFGYEILDAYTIRKVLPRILLAIIGITLSWSILEFLITLTNDVGNGIRAIIYAPFNGLDGKIDLDDSFGILTTVLTGGAFLVLGAMGLLSFGLTALLAVLCAFMVLVLRELIIIVLVIMAPIAIACLILPNTRKFWQIWQNTLTAMLLAFPIISAMIATGKVFSQVTLAFEPEDLIYSMVAFFAYILPYFMLPFAFKFAGGALATIGGLANDRSRGAFDRLRKYRGDKMEKNVHGLKTGQRFNEAGNFIPGSGRVARRFNRTTGAVGTGMQGHFGIGERGRQAISQQQELNAAEGIMKNPRWGAVNNNDLALRAMTYASASQAMTGLQREGMSQEQASIAVNAARASVGFGRAQQFAAARQLVSTGTGYSDVDDMATVLGRVADGNSSSASSLAGFSNSEAKRVGRGDLAPSFGTLDAMVQNKSGTRFDKGAPSKGEVLQNAWESVSLYQHGNGKPTAIKNFAKHYEDRIQNGSEEEKVQALTFFQDLKNMKSGANGAVSGEIDRILDRNNTNIAQVSSMPGTAVHAINNAALPRDGSQPRPMTLGEHASVRARSYRDPNVADRE